MKKITRRVSTPEPTTSDAPNTTPPKVRGKSAQAGIPPQPANTAQEPADQAFNPPPIVVECQLPPGVAVEAIPARAIITWPEIKPKQKKLRTAARSSYAIPQLDSIGKPTPEAVALCVAQPDRTAVDDILDALRAGDLPVFFLALSLSPAYLLEPQIYAATIATWWPQKYFDTPEGKEARKNLRKIGSVLADPLGRPEGEKAERERKKQASNLQAQHDRRALQYCARAWLKFKEAEARLAARGITDTNSLRTAALNIAEEEFSRGTAAKEEGKRLFLQRVKQDLAK